MHDRLTKLFLTSPPTNTPWMGPPPEWQHPLIERPDGRRIKLGLPLFWYDPPWHQLPLDRANALAIAVAQQGILVSALRSDLAASDASSPFHDDAIAEHENSEEETEDTPPQPRPRMLPYRPERYGLADRDFDGARIIDVRLTMHRDDSGRFAYSAAQIERWEATPSGQPVSGGSWVPCATFPPDVVSMHQLGSKLDQLRMLSPDAAVFVSIGPWRLQQELTAVLANRPDGVILRLDELTCGSDDAMELAALTKHARRLADHVASPQFPLWIVPGSISVPDAAKLIALGASAVAIDQWCDSLWGGAISQDRTAAARLGYTSMATANAAYMNQLVHEDLHPLVTRFAGLLNSIQTMPPEQRLACLNQEWSERLGLSIQIIPSFRS